MNRISKRETRLLIATAVIAVVSVLQIGVIRPLYKDVKRVRAKVLLSAQDLQRMRAVAANKEAVAAAYEEIRNRIASTRTTEREIIDILQTIQTAAEKSGVEVLENVYTKERVLEYYQRQTVRFKGRGAPRDLVRMLYDLQEPTLLLKILAMDFTMKNYKLEAEFEIMRVFYTAPKGAGS